MYYQRAREIIRLCAQWLQFFSLKYIVKVSLLLHFLSFATFSFFCYIFSLLLHFLSFATFSRFCYIFSLLPIFFSFYSNFFLIFAFFFLAGGGLSKGYYFASGSYVSLPPPLSVSRELIRYSLSSSPTQKTGWGEVKLNCCCF